MTTSEASTKGCCWSVTINNPTGEDFQNWETLRTLHWVREVVGQVEKGENGTPHIQGMVKTVSVRFAQVKKALPRAHIEKARSETALTKYVQKEETRVAQLPQVKVATLPDVQTMCLTVALMFCYQQDSSLDPLDTNELDLIQRYEYAISNNWELILDRAVRALIYQGYYGVEFVVSNPQVRTAFRKYLPAILYRTYNATRQEATQATQAPTQGQSTQDA